MVSGLITAIFSAENKARKNDGRAIGVISIIFNVMRIITFVILAIFCLYSVFALIYGIANQKFYLIIPSASIIASLPFVWLTINVKSFELLTTICAGLFLVIGVVSLLAVFLFSFQPDMLMPYVMDSTYSEKFVGTIQIEKFKQVDYANVSGGYYVKTTPSEAYYYEMRTDNGGTTTKHIDGKKSYVEKFEDNQYVNNPHIDIYIVERQYVNWYDEVLTETERYNYYIYIPENGILFYEEQ